MYRVPRQTSSHHKVQSEQRAIIQILHIIIIFIGPSWLQPLAEVEVSLQKHEVFKVVIAETSPLRPQ